MHGISTSKTNNDVRSRAPSQRSHRGLRSSIETVGNQDKGECNKIRIKTAILKPNESDHIVINDRENNHSAELERPEPLRDQDGDKEEYDHDETPKLNLARPMGQTIENEDDQSIEEREDIFERDEGEDDGQLI